MSLNIVTDILLSRISIR